MTIEDRVEKYKEMFKDSVAVEPVRAYLTANKQVGSELVRLEAIRELNTALSDLYEVSLPVITVWVRDDSYVQATGEIYLTEPHLGSFLHQFRHHLQNVERKYERRGLTAESCSGTVAGSIIYKDTVYKMYGEDDARAWVRAITELANGFTANDMN